MSSSSYNPETYDAKERIRSAVDIVDLVGSYRDLRREGRVYKCLCPWHNDNRPSMTVDPERQTYRCWVCDIGGDIFSFVERIEGIGFIEALKMLAERAGVSLDERTQRQSTSADNKAILYETMHWAEELFHRCLMEAPEAEHARLYLDDRGISEQSIERFRLGYAPGEWDWVAKQKRPDSIKLEHLAQLGVIKARDRGGFYDFYRNRVMFPIHDAQGRSVGLGGRVLDPDSEEGKYLNSPESAIFSKSSLLYALDLARGAIRKEECAVVVEGYTDVIIAQQMGIENVVAVLGTALGPRHLRKALRPFCERVVLVLDGDEAGQKRTNEILELFVAEQFDLRILTIPQGLDPCDYLLEHGTAKFRELLGGAVDALEHKLTQMHAVLGDSTRTHESNQAIEDILLTLAKAPRLGAQSSSATRLKEDQVLHRISQRSGVPETSLRSRLAELRKSSKSKLDYGATSLSEEIEKSRTETTADAWECELLEVILLEPALLPEVQAEVSTEEIASPLCRRLLTLCFAERAAGRDPTFDRLLVMLDDARLKNLLVDLEERGRTKEVADPADWLQQILGSIRQRRVLRQRQQQLAAMRQGQVDEQQGTDFILQLLEQERQRQGITDPTDG